MFFLCCHNPYIRLKVGSAFFYFFEMHGWKWNYEENFCEGSSTVFTASKYVRRCVHHDYERLAQYSRLPSSCTTRNFAKCTHAFSWHQHLRYLCALLTLTVQLALFVYGWVCNNLVLHVIWMAWIRPMILCRDSCCYHFKIPRKDCCIYWTLGSRYLPDQNVEIENTERTTAQ